MKNLLIIGGSGAIGQGIKGLFDDYKVYWVNSKEFPLPYLPDPFGWEDIDIVLNLAGLSVLHELHKYNILTNKVIQVNCAGAVTVLNAFLPHMRKRKWGRIIMMSSVCSEINLIGHGVYSASKAFVDKLVKIAALENAEYGITVNSIQLGYTGIGLVDQRPDSLVRQKNKSALKRFVTMEEIVQAVKFCIDTEYFTGQNLRLDGFIK